MQFLNEATEFKALVLSALPKLFTDDEFVGDERIALSIFIQRHGLDVESYNASLLALDDYEEKEKYLQSFIDGLLLGVENTFRIYYGIY